MEQVIQGHLAASAVRAGASRHDPTLAEDRPLPTAEFEPSTQATADVNVEEAVRTLENATRKALLSRAIAQQRLGPSSAGRLPSSSELQAAYRALGAVDLSGSLSTDNLKVTLAKLWDQDPQDPNNINDEHVAGTGAAVAAAGSNAVQRLAVRITGTEGGTVDYKGFCDWLVPSRSLSELFGLLVELLADGTAVGLTAAALFRRLCLLGGISSVCAEEGEVRIGRRELVAGLAALDVHVTDTEAKVLMKAACTPGGPADVPQQLTLDIFVAFINHWNGQGARAATTRSRPGSCGRDSEEAVKNIQQTDSPPRTSSLAQDQEEEEPAPVHESEDVKEQGKEQEDAEKGDGCVSIDSFASIVSPPMSVSELTVLVAESTPAALAVPSTSAAAHAEAFGRVAADVQAVLKTAMSAEVEQTMGPSATAFQPAERVTGTPEPDASIRVARSKAEGETDKDMSPQPAAPRADLVPLARAVTPPMGPARSQTEPLHPTRDSRERLEAALENLDLKEHLKPIINAGSTRETHTSRSASAQLSTCGEQAPRCRSDRAHPAVQNVSAAALVASSASLAREVRQSKSSKNFADGAAMPTFKTRSQQNLHARHKKRIPTSSMDAPTDAAAPTSATKSRGGRLAGYSQASKGRLMGGPNLTVDTPQEMKTARHRDDGIEDGDDEFYEGYGLARAPEVIGSLRARVAELELTEELLRCELEGARADLVDSARRAAEESEEAVEKAKESERLLQAKLRTRVRVADARAARAESRMAEFKRSTAADAAAREKASAEYLRRRLREVTATLETKLARRATIQHAKEKRSALPPRSKREFLSGLDEEGHANSARGAGDTDGTVKRGLGVRCGRLGATVMSGHVRREPDVIRLRKELDGCRKKLASAEAEASRLRAEHQTAALADAVGDRQRSQDENQRMERHGLRKDEPRRLSSAEHDTSRKRTPMKGGKGCSVCRRQRQRSKDRERALEARLVQSEDARIEVEAEASRLQAFLDEMRGLGPPVGMTAHGYGPAE